MSPRVERAFVCRACSQDSSTLPKTSHQKPMLFFEKMHEKFSWGSQPHSLGDTIGIQCLHVITPCPHAIKDACEKLAPDTFPALRMVGSTYASVQRAGGAKVIYFRCEMNMHNVQHAHTLSQFNALETNTDKFPSVVAFQIDSHPPPPNPNPRPRFPKLWKCCRNHSATVQWCYTEARQRTPIRIVILLFFQDMEGDGSGGGARFIFHPSTLLFTFALIFVIPCDPTSCVLTQWQRLITTEEMHGRNDSYTSTEKSRSSWLSFRRLCTIQTPAGDLCDNSIYVHWTVTAGFPLLLVQFFIACKNRSGSLPFWKISQFFKIMFPISSPHIMCTSWSIFRKNCEM